MPKWPRASSSIRLVRAISSSGCAVGPLERRSRPRGGRRRGLGGTPRPPRGARGPRGEDRLELGGLVGQRHLLLPRRIGLRRARCARAGTRTGRRRSRAPRARAPGRAASPRARRRGRGRSSAPSSRGREASSRAARRRPTRVGGSRASSRSRSRWLLRMAVTVAVLTPRPTLREAVFAPWPPAPDGVAQRRAGDEHHRGQQAQHHQDRRPHAPDRGVGGPVAGLAHEPTALLDDARLEPALAGRCRPGRGSRPPAPPAAPPSPRSGRAASGGPTGARGRGSRATPRAIRASGTSATARPTSRRVPSSSHPPTGPAPKPRKSETARKIARATRPEAEQLARLGVEPRTPAGAGRRTPPTVAVCHVGADPPPPGWTGRGQSPPEGCWPRAARFLPG